MKLLLVILNLAHPVLSLKHKTQKFEDKYFILARFLTLEPQNCVLSLTAMCVGVSVCLSACGIVAFKRMFQVQI